MPPIAPKPRLSEHPIFFMALAVGAIAFVVGAVITLILYSLGGPDMVVVGIAIGVVVFAIGFNALLRLRERDGMEP